MPKDLDMVPLTLAEFYKNPAGKKVSGNNAGLVRQALTNRYDAVKKLGRNISYIVYEENDRSYYIHFIVPSDMHESTYDVVIHVFDEFGMGGGSFKKWNLHIFSNCPSFVFAYAYVYNEYGLNIPFLKGKLNDVAYTQPPVQTNPDMNIMYDKSVFYALHTIMNTLSLSQRYMVNKIARNFSPKILLKEVRSFDEIMAQEREKAARGITVKRVINNIENTVRNLVNKHDFSKQRRDVGNHRITAKAKKVGKPKITAKAKIGRRRK